MDKQGIYIFEKETDFLKVFEKLNQYYRDKPRAIYLSKHLTSYKELNKEIAFIDKCNVNGFSGFRTAKQIKISITDGLNCNYCVTYTFNGSGSGTIYDKFNRYLKRRDNIYI